MKVHPYLCREHVIVFNGKRKFNQPYAHSFNSKFLAGPSEYFLRYIKEDVEKFPLLYRHVFHGIQAWNEEVLYLLLASQHLSQISEGLLQSRAPLASLPVHVFKEPHVEIVPKQHSNLPKIQIYMLRINQTLCLTLNTTSIK